LAVTTLKQLWKNEYFQTAIMIILMVVIVFGFWYGCQLALNTEHPALAVVSESMLPTLNVGDVIIVQGVTADQINANNITGDIVVFRSPINPEYRIVHRAIKIDPTPYGYRITTHGDNNPLGSNEQFDADYLIGKVIARIPYVGNFALYVNALGNFYYFLIVIIIIVNILISIFFDTDEEKKPKEEPQEKRKLFGKLNIEIVFIVILNVLLISFIAFNLFGSFTFWQLGKEPNPGYVTIYGMYSDVHFHELFVSKTFLSNGFLTYKIDSQVSGGIRSGVTTFSWTQASILILILLNIWMLNKHLHFDRRLKQALKT